MSNFTANLGLLKRPGVSKAWTRPRSVGLKDNLGGDGGRWSKWQVLHKVQARASIHG
jgi:hypothetical protein